MSEKVENKRNVLLRAISLDFTITFTNAIDNLETTNIPTHDDMKASARSAGGKLNQNIIGLLLLFQVLHSLCII